MDQTKSQVNESLKEENFRLRQQMMEMYPAWASELPLSSFLAIDPTDTSSFPLKSQSWFSTVVDASQHDSEFILSQKYSNTSSTFPLASQYKLATLIAPHTTCAFVAQPSTEASTLAINTTVVLPQAASGFMFNTLDDHCYISEPTSMLIGPPQFLNKKPKDNFTPIGESYASLFQTLRELGIIISLLGHTLNSRSKNFDPNIRCAYYSATQGHSIEDCRDLKREIEKMIQDRAIMVQNIGSEENSSHADMQTSG
ncbi:hypothetical protein P3L10_033360 [Capsicum annuum]